MQRLVGEFDMNIISKYISMDEVRNNRHLKWNKVYLSSNKNIRRDILDLDLPNSIGEWNLQSLSINLPLEDILSDTARTYDRSHISCNPSMRMRYLDEDRSHLTGNWDIYKIHLNIDVDGVVEDRDYDWIIDLLSRNQNFNNAIVDRIGLHNRHMWQCIEEEAPEEILYHLPDTRIMSQGFWYYASKRAPLSIIKKYSNEKRDRYGISMNVDVTIDDIDDLHLPNATGDYDIATLIARSPMRSTYKYLYDGMSRNTISHVRDLTIREMEIFSPKVGIHRMYSFNDLDVHS